MIYQLDTYCVMIKNKANYAVENTIQKFHIQKNMHMTYKQDFYKNKEREQVIQEKIIHFPLFL